MSMKLSNSILLISTFLLLTVACSPPAAVSDAHDRGLPVSIAPTDMAQYYRDLGLVASPPPISLVGKISYFATRSSDTTLALISISVANRSLTFAREGERYRAPYEVHVRLLRGDVEAAAISALEVVRVGAFKETNRSDESIIFQHFFRAAPGAYTLSLALRDVGGSRATTQELAVVVPRISSTGFSSPLLAYESSFRTTPDSIPRILVSPRSSAVFGRDSLVNVFLEAYGAGDRLPVRYVVSAGNHAPALSDSTVLIKHGSIFSGTIGVPISMVGLGITRLTFTRKDATDTASAPLFVSFGEDIPIMSFENMIDYLRFFAPVWRLKALRDASPARRASVWAAFLKDTDPIPETAVNEELDSYFARVQQANIQFSNDRNPGWLSDRGMVFVALGEPYEAAERTVTQGAGRTQAGQSTRVLVWAYPQYHTQLVFYDETGHWRLTRASENEFWAVTSRKMARQ